MVQEKTYVLTPPIVDMAQLNETLNANMPCPDCGSQHLIQHTSRSEDVYVTQNGDFEMIEPRDPVDVEELWCPECDEKLWSKQ